MVCYGIRSPFNSWGIGVVTLLQILLVLGALEAIQKCGGKNTAACTSHICIAKTNSYGQFIESVQANAPTAPPIPAPMSNVIHDQRTIRRT